MNRIVPLLGVAAGLGMSATCMAEQPKKMNVLFIAVDDLKPTLGAYGDTIAVTPAIDRLAREGVVFRQTYCQQAISAATRASLLTGMRPDKTRVWDLVTDFRQVNSKAVSLPEYFKENGYESVAWGKIFHIGSAGTGHDAPSWSIPYTNVKAPKYALPTELNARGKGTATECADVADDFYLDGKLASEAVQSMAELSRSDKPFFLAVGFLKPHLPFVAPKKYWDLYQREEMPLAPYQKKAKGSPDIAYHNSGELKSYTDIPQFDSWSEEELKHLSVDKQKELIHGYYAAVSYMDAQVQKLLDALDRLGIADNTIVIFWGDHGWHLGDHGLWNKHTNFENATHVPMLMRVPGMKQGIQVQGLCEFVDIFPTLCDLTGLAIPDWLDGESLVPALKSPDRKLREYAFSQYPRTKKIMGYSIRTDNMRYTEWFDSGYNTSEPYDPKRVIGREMYDYENDPLETENVIGKASYAKQQKRMEKLFREAMAREHAQCLRFAERADYHDPINTQKGYKDPSLD